MRADTVVGAFFPGSVSGESSIAEAQQTVADMVPPVIPPPASSSVPDRKQSYTNGSAQPPSANEVDGEKTSLFADPNLPRKEFPVKERVPWVTTLIGLAVVALLVLGGLSASPKLVQSITSMLGLSGEDEGDNPPLPKHTPAPPGPVTEEPTPAKVEPTPEVVAKVPEKWTQPAPPAGGFTDSSIAALPDGELGWLLSKENADVVSFRIAILEAGRRTSEDLTLLLVDATKNTDFKVRVDALKALSRAPHYKREKAVEAILELLNDKEFIVRGFAAKILASVGGPKAVQALEARAKEETNAVVSKVLNDSLGQLKRSPGGSSS